MSGRRDFIDLSDEDEELARRLQEEENARAGIASGSRSAPAWSDDEELARRLQEEEEEAQRMRIEREQEQERAFQALLQSEEEERKQQEARNAGSARCPICQRDYPLADMHWVEACPHRFCRSCLRGYIDESFKKKVYTGIQCPQGGCGKPIQIADLQELLSPDEFHDFQEKTLFQLVDSSDQYVRCPGDNCSAVIEKLAARFDRPPAPQPASGGSSRMDEAEREKALKRFRCHACNTEFCAGCKAVPYHEGRTCDEHKAYICARHCRFCTAQLPDSDAVRSPGGNKTGGSGQRRRRTEGGSDVCRSDECREKQRQSCKTVHNCGHPCLGIVDEAEHIPCMEPGCAASRPGAHHGGVPAADVAFPPAGGALAEAARGGPAAGRGQQGSDDFCMICYVEALRAAPCLRLACGHVFHAACARDRLAKRWPGVRVTFAFWSCPICQRKMEHEALREVLRPLEELHADLQNKARQRLEAEGMGKDPLLTDPASRFFNNPTALAMHRLSYYPCSKCNKPYFAGRANCEGAAQAEAELMVDEEKRKDLICGPCSANPADNCPKHGRDYIEFKCKFCCTVACWFCWGTTHFCDACHKVAATIVRQPVETLPACACPPGSRPHPRNGTAEVCLGCSLCRIMGTF